MTKQHLSPPASTVAKAIQRFLSLCEFSKEHAWPHLQEDEHDASEANRQPDGAGQAFRRREI